MDEVYLYALKLLARRDYSETQLREKLVAKFPAVSDATFASLRGKGFLNDKRFAENFTAKHPDSHSDWIQTALGAAGVASETAAEIVANRIRPSLRDVANARMSDWRLRPPLQRKDAARLFRALGRLGYPEEEIREELERLHE